MKGSNFDPSEIDRRQDPERELRSDLRFFTLLIAIVILFTWFFPRYVYTTMEVKGGSMLPTFDVAGERVVVLKVGGYNYGDVVIIWVDLQKHPTFTASESEFIIKRVIGLPGDTVSLKYDTIEQEYFVNLTKTDGSVVVLRNEPYINEPMSDAHKSVVYTVGENEVFVAGDNRNISQDSFSVGCFNKTEVFGTVVLKIDINDRYNRDFVTDYNYQTGTAS